MQGGDDRMACRLLGGQGGARGGKAHIVTWGARGCMGRIGSQCDTHKVEEQQSVSGL